MRADVEKSLNVAMKYKQLIMAKNRFIYEILEKIPDLCDEAQLVLAEAGKINTQEFETAHELVCLLAERLEMVGEVGLEKQCRYEEDTDQ